MIRTMKLKTYLKRNKLTAKQFSKLTGISPPSIHNYIHGKKTPSLDSADRIVRASKGRVTLRDLLDGANEQDEREPAAA